MQEPITANYIPDGDDWNITVVTGTETRTATAAGLLAARDKVDQLVEKLEEEQDTRTVVHLLNGDAFAFTTSYLQARLGIAATAPAQPAPVPSPEEATERAAPVPAVVGSALPSDSSSTSGDHPEE